MVDIIMVMVMVGSTSRFRVRFSKVLESGKCYW